MCEAADEEGGCVWSCVEWLECVITAAGTEEGELVREIKTESIVFDVPCRLGDDGFAVWVGW